MNIHDYLKTLPFIKAQFVRYHFNLWFDPDRTMTEDEFLKTVQRKSMASFNRFMQSEEWKHITVLVLASKTADDLKAMYDSVAVKARQGDYKAIETLLKLQKQIDHYKREAYRAYRKIGKDDPEDDLEI